MSMMVSFVLSFFPRDVLDEILNLIESVSEDFPSYSYSEEFEVKFGDQQGSVLSPLFFIIVLEALSRESWGPMGGPLCW